MEWMPVLDNQWLWRLDQADKVLLPGRVLSGKQVHELKKSSYCSDKKNQALLLEIIEYQFCRAWSRGGHRLLKEVIFSQ